MMKTCVCTILLAVLVMGLVGCDQAVPVYTATTGGYLGADISSKRLWRLTGEMANPQAAADEDLTTSAQSDYNSAGAALTIDLGRPCLFQTVILDHGNARDGHARRIAVAVSMDGRTFIDQHVGPGKRRVTIVSLPKPVLARYVRVRVVGSGPQPWSVAEVYLQ